MFFDADALLDGDVIIVGKVAAQARDKAEVLENLVTKDARPATNDIKRMRLMGAGALALLGISLAMIGTGIMRTNSELVLDLTPLAP